MLIFRFVLIFGGPNKESLLSFECCVLWSEISEPLFDEMGTCALFKRQHEANQRQSGEGHAEQGGVTQGCYN